MDIALFGGTFNPIHLGHLNLARHLLYEDKLIDKIVFMPSLIPPHKDMCGNISPEERIKMIKLAISGYREMSVSKWEIERGGISYTIDTVKEWVRDDQGIVNLGLKKKQHIKKFIIIGSDSAANLYTWKDWQEIVSSIRIIVYPRQGYEDWLSVLRKDKNWQEKYKLNFIPFPGVYYNLDSTSIRNKIKNKRSIRGMIPVDLIEYIKTNRLYTK